MFAKSSKKGVLEQVQEFADDLADKIQPVVEKALDEIGPALSDARDKAAPVIDSAREKAGPVIADARDKAAPVVNEARDRFVNEVVPLVTAAAATASEKSEPLREEAKRRGAATAAALKGEVDAPSSGGSKLKKVLIAGGLLGLGAYAFSKLRGSQDDGWQQSYTPKPAPEAAPGPVAAPAAPVAGDPLTDDEFGSQAKGAPAPVDSDLGGAAGTDAPSAAGDDDAAASSPDEAASDATDSPHDVTTPDAPAEEVDVEKVEDPKP